MSGSAWDALVDDAYGDWGSVDLGDLDSDHDVYVLAGALVAVRTGDAALLDEVVDALDTVRTSGFSRVLELSRNLQSYVFAADLIDLATVAPDVDAEFRTFLEQVRHEPLEGHSGGDDLESTAALSANNWGNHARAAMAAITLYLGDEPGAAEVADWHLGWIGDRATYTGFGSWEDSGWHCDFDAPVGINPVGCTLDGHDADGLLPEDERRSGDFTWPAPKEGYTWEALQGAVVAGVVLDRAGLVPLSAEDDAILRAVEWHYRPNFDGGDTFPAEGDDTWQIWVIDAVYATDLPTEPSESGKNMGYTDWTHAP
ncbi:MAG: hypothetical protein ABMB14_37340 [Myxococcota bacterium]